jgi:hypothetical protein
MVIDEKLKQLVQQTTYLNQGDKDFILQKIPEMSALEKMRLRGSLTSGEVPQILQNLQLLRAKFQEKEQPQEKSNQNFLDKLTSKFNKPTKPQVVASSIFTKPDLLGTKTPLKPIRPKSDIQPLNSLTEIYHPAQLAFLHPNHLQFTNDNEARQALNSFSKKVEKIFDKIENVDVKRGFFMTFLQSTLFKAYINTALTAMKHQELTPRNAVLNLLYQIHQKYLNRQQFALAAEISHILRGVSGL